MIPTSPLAIVEPTVPLAAEIMPATSRIDEGKVMATNEERLAILRMIEQGKITAEEGARLLTALGNRQKSQAAAPETSGSGKARYLRIRVTDSVTGQQKVRVNVPIGLVSLGLRFVPESAGVNVQAIRQAIESDMTGHVVDVLDEEGGNHVEILLE
jgi:hypothetical protein